MKKLRNEEIEKEKRERIEAARENGGGKATMAKWEENKKNKIIKNETNSKPIKKDPKPRLRGEYRKGYTSYYNKLINFVRISVEQVR